MAEETQPPDLTGEEKKLFEKYMPRDLHEIIALGMQRRHFLQAGSMLLLSKLYPLMLKLNL
ncbi:MAG: hypothetical protein AVDCRST_MAG56-6072 [uncultured Cytophagales bacterium]|uniref:Uncharacterized protein n=1 Tax=uncultured Cytophagales bacterium TaxID=158755 RepID=A0A6J4KL64_9SPHI|nr:MAG: hypothetical protein AVDCRST_MAG56-6072 [uncultured Cytophagales bacterium]